MLFTISVRPPQLHLDLKSNPCHYSEINIGGGVIYAHLATTKHFNESSNIQYFLRIQLFWQTPTNPTSNWKSFFANILYWVPCLFVRWRCSWSFLRETVSGKSARSPAQVWRVWSGILLSEQHQQEAQSGLSTERGCNLNRQKKHFCLKWEKIVVIKRNINKTYSGAKTTTCF